jgi:hypothetical protein
MRRGSNIEGRGMPGCRDGGWKNPESIDDDEFARRWEMAFGKKDTDINTGKGDVTNGPL